MIDTVKNQTFFILLRVKKSILNREKRKKYEKMRDELTQKEYESFINELAGKELSKKEQVRIQEKILTCHRSK